MLGIPTHKETHCIFRDLERKANNIVALALQQAQYHFVEAGYKILNHLQNELLVKVDQLSRQRIEECRFAVQQLEDMLRQRLASVQIIINTFPFANRDPQIGEVTPRYISFTANQNPNIGITLTIPGNFPTIGQDECFLSFNNKRFDPIVRAVHQLQFMIPQTDFARPVANAIVQNQGKLIFRRPYMVFRSIISAQWGIVVGTLPVTPGNIILQMPQPQQIQLNWGENTICPLPNPGWKVIFTPFSGPRREFSMSDLSHHYISIQILGNQLDIGIKDPSTLRLADIQHNVVQPNVVQQAQIPQLIVSDWEATVDMWKEGACEWALYDLEEFEIQQPMIAGMHHLLHGNRLVKMQAVVDVTDFIDLQGSISLYHFKAYNLNGNLVDLNPHPISKKDDSFEDYTFFDNGSALSYSCNKKTVPRKGAYKTSGKVKYLNQEVEHRENTITCRLWDLNQQKEQWSITFNAKNYYENINSYQESIDLSHPNYIMIHLQGLSNSIEDTKAGRGHRDRLAVFDRIDGSLVHELDMGIGHLGNGAFCLDDQTLYLVTLQGCLQRWNCNTWNMDLEIKLQGNLCYAYYDLIPIASNRLLCCSKGSYTNRPKYPQDHFNHSSNPNSEAIQVFDLNLGTHLRTIQAVAFGVSSAFGVGTAVKIYKNIVIKGQAVAEAIITMKTQIDRLYNRKNFYGILNLDTLEEYPIPQEWLRSPDKIVIQEELMLVYGAGYLNVIDLNAFTLVRHIPLPSEGTVIDIDIDIETCRAVALLSDTKSGSTKAQVLYMD